MEEDPDFDYEMEPQAAYAAFQATAEEAMDELSSEGMPMPEVGLRFEAVDKTGIDVDFHDPAALPKTSAKLPSTTASSMQNEEIIDAFQASTSTGPAQNANTAGAIPEAATEGNLHHDEVLFEAPHKGLFHLNGADQSEGHLSKNEEQSQQDDEQDEVHPDEDVSAARAALASADEETDQLQDNEEETTQPSGEEVENAQDVNGQAYYHPEEEQDVAVRVTFHGQDFVIWSATDIPTFLAVARIDDTADPEDEPEDVVQVEAPALEVSKDVLWQPLDSLFTGLRDKKALGEFLDESHELHIAFPDLDLDVAEDNLYCREITLDDLLQLHHGLGIATSLHISVSERPRFITKYNELAQHVAGILSNQLEHSSDDEEEAANTGHLSRNAQASAEALYALEGSQPPAEVATTEELDAEHAAASPKHLTTTDDTNAGPEPLDSTASHTAAAQADEQDATNTEVQAAEDDNNVHDESEQHELETHEQDGTAGKAEEEEGVDELAEDVQEVQEEAEVEEEQVRGGDAAELVAETPALEADHEATAVQEEEEEEDVDEIEHQDSEEDEVGADEEGEAQAEEEQGYEEEEVEEVEGEGQEDEAEYQEEEEDEEYADELGGTGEEAEQTFYTSVNDSSEAEEDELEEPETNGAQTSALEHPVEHLDSTYAYEETAAAADEQDWQKRNEDEEQIVEYIEEQVEGIVNAGSPSSTISTSYNAGAQRKRGLDEDDDDDDDDDGDAAYEQDDYEAENKRVKVD